MTTPNAPIITETHESTVHRMLVLCPHCGARNWLRRGQAKYAARRVGERSCLNCLGSFKIQEVTH